MTLFLFFSLILIGCRNRRYRAECVGLSVTIPYRGPGAYGGRITYSTVLPIQKYNSLQEYLIT